MTQQILARCDDLLPNAILVLLCRLRAIQLPTLSWLISTRLTTELVHWHSTTMESMSVSCSMSFVVDIKPFHENY